MKTGAKGVICDSNLESNVVDLFAACFVDLTHNVQCISTSILPKSQSAWVATTLLPLMTSTDGVLPYTLCFRSLICTTKVPWGSAGVSALDGLLWILVIRSGAYFAMMQHQDQCNIIV